MLQTLSRLSVLLLPCLGLLLLSCTSANRDLFPKDPDERDITVHVVSHGWHVGIILPVDEHFEELIPEIHIHGKHDYAEMGWGDRRYYMDDSPGIWTTIRGGLLPSSSTVHAAGFSQGPELQFSQLERVTINLTEEGYRALLKRAARYFTIDDETGETKPLGDGLYADAQFYHSPRWYYVPKTSNKWVAQMLREAGVPINTFTAVRASNVIRQASRSGQHVK